MYGKHTDKENALPQSELEVFNAALVLLTTLNSKDSVDFQQAFLNLTSACMANTNNKDDVELVQKNIDNFVNKFKRKSSRIYGKEAFDLSVITDSLNTPKLQKLYLNRAETFPWAQANSRQLLNLVSKVINNFELTALALHLKKKYRDQVDLFLIEKYLDPEHKIDQPNTHVTRFTSLLTTMKNKTLENIPQPNPNLFKMEKGWRLYPKNKLNPRLALSKEINEKTPQEIKYNIGKKELATDAAEIAGTAELLKIDRNKHCSQTPGPLCLTYFPLVSSPDPRVQKIPDLIRQFQIVSVVTIEEKVIAEITFENEVKALPSDWLEYGVRVGLVQCPDLTALRIFHTLLVAQYLFSEVLSVLPTINDLAYNELINELMAQRFQETDINPLIKSKHRLPLFQEFTDKFSAKTDRAYSGYLREVMSKLKWGGSEKDPLQTNEDKHQGQVLIHCKAGMSRSATDLLTMYIFYIDVILRWHSSSFIKDEHDEEFFGTIVKALFQPSAKPKEDVHNIIRSFKHYRDISPIEDQVVALAQLIQFKQKLLIKEKHCLENTNTNNSYQRPEINHNATNATI